LRPTATDELRKHIDGGDEKVDSEGEKNPSLKQGLHEYAGTMDSVVSLEGTDLLRRRILLATDLASEFCTVWNAHQGSDFPEQV
jgi:hypothetical protein